MKLTHFLALLLIPAIGAAGAIAATWSRRARDLIFFLIVALAVVAERVDVNYFSRAWYRGTTRGLEISLPTILAGSLLIGCLLGARGDERRPRAYWPGSLGLMLLYLLYAGLSVLTSEPRLYGFFEFTKIAGGLLVFLASALYLRSRREWTVLVVALSCAVGFEGLLAMKQKIFTHLERACGTLDHANSLSMYLCLATAPLIAVAYAGWTRRLRWLAGLASAVAAVGLVLSVSRAGIPVFALAALCTFFLCASWKLSTSMLVKRGALVLAAVMLVAVLWPQIAARYGSATLQEEYLDESVDGRGVYLRLARNIAKDHFFGVGLNNWSYYVSQTYGPQLGYQFENYDRLLAIYGQTNVRIYNERDLQSVFDQSYLAAPAHNLGALTLGELGVPGLLLFLLLWARWFSMGLPLVFGRRDDPVRTLGVGLFFGLCGIFGQSLTEWVFRQSPIFITFNILVGALASLAYERRLRRREAVAMVPAAPALASEPLLVPREA